MQVAKNLFLLPAKSYLRKLVEIPLTFAIELAWPKWRILEIYLNIVEWGPGVFGAEAASQAHFRRSAMGLTSRQAAQLAVTLPNPIIRDAGDPGPRTAQRASVIQARAARNPEAVGLRRRAPLSLAKALELPPECEYKAPHVRPGSDRRAGRLHAMSFQQPGFERA